jgi:hypothetical protein
MSAEALLARLSEWRPAGPGPHSLLAPVDAGWELSITADHSELLGCLASEVSVVRSAAPCSAADLTRWAVRSAQRITGLLEPLKVIEVDATRSEAILRSDGPAPRGDRVHYYELLLRGTRAATLRRFQAERAGGKREPIPFALTHESIAKLAGDLIVD